MYVNSYGEGVGSVSNYNLTNNNLGTKVNGSFFDNISAKMEAVMLALKDSKISAGEVLAIENTTKSGGTPWPTNDADQGATQYSDAVATMWATTQISDMQSMFNAENKLLENLNGLIDQSFKLLSS